MLMGRIYIFSLDWNVLLAICLGHGLFCRRRCIFPKSMLGEAYCFFCHRVFATVELFMVQKNNQGFVEGSWDINEWDKQKEMIVFLASFLWLFSNAHARRLLRSVSIQTWNACYNEEDVVCFGRHYFILLLL